MLVFCVNTKIYKNSSQELEFNKCLSPVVDNHVVALDVWVVFGHPLAGGQEEAVGELHDVGLVDDGDPLAPVGPGVLEGVPAEPLGVFLRHNLQALHHSGHVLVLKHGVLALSVLKLPGLFLDQEVFYSHLPKSFGQKTQAIGGF